MKIDHRTLENGLRVVHMRDEHTQSVALNLIYGVGARDEDPLHTGFAHLFEHLMFGGSRNVQDFDTPVEKAGGESNAWTSNDITDYYITIPKENLETALFLESDRMLELDFRPRNLEIQRSVVVEEFKQRCMNKPYGDVSHLVRALAYRAHPYRWPTLGLKPEHIQNATMEEVRDFFFRFYAPDNAILSVVGNVSWEEVQRLVLKWFSDIPYRGVQRRTYPQEPRQKALRRQEVLRNVPCDSLYMAFHMSSCTDAEFPVFDMISDVLANGDSARLTSRLVRDEQLFSKADAYVDCSLDPGLFHVHAHLMPGVSFEQAESALWRELDLLGKSLAGDQELEKVRNKFESAHVFNDLSIQELAYSLARSEMTGRAEDHFLEVERYRQVGHEDLMRTASRSLVRDNCSVLWYRCRKDGQTASEKQE